MWQGPRSVAAALPSASHAGAPDNCLHPQTCRLSLVLMCCRADMLAELGGPLRGAIQAGGGMQGSVAPCA